MATASVRNGLINTICKIAFKNLTTEILQTAFKFSKSKDSMSSVRLSKYTVTKLETFIKLETHIKLFSKTLPHFMSRQKLFENGRTFIMK